MKKIICAITIVLLLASKSFATGIPVIDIAALANQMVEIVHLVTQIQTLEEQLDTMGDQLDNASGSRGLGNLLDTVYEIEAAIDAAQIMADNGLESYASLGITGDAATIGQDDLNNDAIYLGQADRSLQQAKDRFSELTGLISKINSSPDEKDILDLTARIEAEGVFLQNEMIKLQMLSAKNEAEKEVVAERKTQQLIKSAGELHDTSGFVFDESTWGKQW